MAIEVCFIAGATCGTDTEIAKTRLCDGHRVETTGRKPADVTSYSSAFLTGTLDVERKDQLEMAAVLPIIAVVFTVGGPVVYEQGHHPFPITTRRRINTYTPATDLIRINKPPV